MSIFLVIQNTYDELQIALMRESLVIDSRTISKMKASTLFISTLENLLDDNHVQLKQIPFIAVNQGPGPFTTLRVVIASANGLSFASHIPLIGIDGLEAFIKEYTDISYPNTVVLLNAFNQDVYFAIQTPHELQTGYHNIDVLLAQIQKPHKPIRFLGNGTQMHREKIIALFGADAFIPDPLPLYCSIQQIGIMGLEQWQHNKAGATQLLPLYLKKHPVQS